MPKALFTFGLIYLLANSSVAQIQVSRNFEAHPLSQPMTEERRVLGNTFFGAEMGLGFFSAEEEQTWNVKFHGFIEFYRWGNRASIGLSLAHELHANPFNEINFNPRGAIWNESLVYYRKVESATLQFGLNHRCRHNIDNADPPSPNISRLDYIPQSRVLVLTGISAGFLADPIELHPSWQFTFFARADAYIYTEDARRPRTNQEGSWEDIRGSAFTGISIIHPISDLWQVYSRNHFNYVIFEQDNNQVNYRAELGISLTGEKARTSLFLAFERFFDDTSRPFPLPSSVLSIGIRGLSLDFY